MGISERLVRGERMTPESLKEWMNKEGISTKELSEILGISMQAIRLWLSGERAISVTISRLIKAFKKYPQLLKEF